MIATQQIAGNSSGIYIRIPKVVVMHSTRSGQAHFSDSQELGATLSWFVNPEGASSHWVLSEKERVRVVKDTLIAWHSTYLNGRSWGVEMTQPTIDRPFTDGHYANAALIGQNYVSLGVAPVWLDYWDGGDESGFVAHEDTIQGRQSGKSDPGPKFDRARFIASLEDKPTEEEDMSKHIHSPSKVGMELFGFKRELPNDKEHQAIHAMGYKDTPITDAQWDDLVNFPSGGAASGLAPLSAEETVEAVKQAQREGTS